MAAHTAAATGKLICHDLESAATANDFTEANAHFDKNLICPFASAILSIADRDG
jgi:hypothetical protein